MADITQHGSMLKDDNNIATPYGNYLNITGQATAVAKSGPGFLHTLTLNSATALGTITIYDNTAASGTKIATITAPATLLQNQFTLIFDVAFSVGLTIVTGTASQDITVSYR